MEFGAAQGITTLRFAKFWHFFEPYERSASRRYRVDAMMFLDEISGKAKIVELLEQAEKAKLAVAFWGKGAIEALGLARTELDVEIICNLDSGACNPSEIRKLMELRPSNPVWSNPRLHGKVYWTANGAVIGSSNASTNGLGGEGSLAGWAEANVFSSETDVLKSVHIWLESCKAGSYEVGDDDLRRAEKIWNERARAAPTGGRLNLDLGDAVRSAPRHAAWTKVKLAIYSEDYSPDGRRQIKRDRLRNPVLKDYEAYEDWGELIKAGDWLLDFELNNKIGDFAGIFAVPAPEIKIGSMTYARNKSSVELPGLGKLKLSKADERALEKVAYELAAEKTSARSPYATIPINEAFGFIDKRARAAAKG